MNWKITDGMFYVSRTYGKDTNNGSKDAPFATMRRGMKAIYDGGNIAGSKLVLEGGVVYDEDITTSNVGGDGYNPTSRNGIYFVCDGCKGVIADYINLRFGVISTIRDRLENFHIQFRSTYSLVSNITSVEIEWVDCFFESYMHYYTFQNSINHLTNCIVLDLYSVSTSSYVTTYIFRNSIVINWTKIEGRIIIDAISTYFANLVNVEILGIPSYNAVPSNSVLSTYPNTLLDVDPLFVDINSNNFNLTPTSPLLNSGKPNPTTGKPTNIGGTYLSQSINGSDLSLNLTGIVVDADNSFLLDGGSSIGIIESSIIDLGIKKSIVKLDLNSIFDYDSDGFPIAMLDKNSTIAKGTAQSATTDTLVLSATEILNTTDDYYNGMYVKITAGTGLGEMHLITDYDATSKTITLSDTWTITPDNTSQYLIVEKNRISFDFEVKWSDIDPSLSDMPEYRLMEMCEYLTYSDNINKYGNADPNYVHANRNYVAARYIQFRITMKRIV